MISTKQVYLSDYIQALSKRRRKLIKTSTKHHNIVFTWFTPLLGLRPPTLLLYILWSIGYKHRDIKTLTPHRKKDLHSSLDPSFLHYSTRPSTVSHRDLHSALQVSHKMHKALITQIQLLSLSQLAQLLRTIQLLLTLPSLLFIHTK